MSEEVKKAIETVTATMSKLDSQGRKEYAAMLEGTAMGAELAARKEPDHEKDGE